MKESIAFNFPFQTYASHVTELSTFGHAISERYWKATFYVTEIINNFGLKQGTVCQIVKYLPLFSETTHTILKIFSQRGLRKPR